MNELEIFYDNLDRSDYDSRSRHKINQELQTVSTVLNEKGEFKLFKKSELERQGFAIIKSFDKKEDRENGTLNGLSWTTSGNKTLEDKSVVPFYWPDVTKLTKEDFEYFEERYKKTKNLYSKTEFGLLIYFGGKTRFSNHRDFKISLFENLFSLSKTYLEKSKNPNDKNHYILDYISTLKAAFQLALKAKISPELKKIIEHVYETHQNWDVTNNGSLRILLDLSSLSSEYFKNFKNEVDYEKIISKNLEGAKEQEKTHTWGAIYIVDICIKISKKINIDFTDLLKYKAELYLKLSNEADKNNNIASVSFTETALRLYQQVKDSTKIQEIEKLYSEQRGKFKMATISQTLPEEEAKRITTKIISTVNSFNELQIIETLIASPWFSNIDGIREMAENSKKASPFLSMLGSSVIDKFGNTIDKFNTEEEREEYNFWQSFGFSFQIGKQTMHKFFIEAYKANKLSFESIKTFLEGTWFNEPISRNYNGEKYDILPIHLVLPGIKKIFEELDKFSNNNNYEADYVLITDSLVLKVETLIRNFCEKIGISTFKTRQKGKDELVMEKLLDDLLADIKHSDNNPTGFDEEDRVLIKYVMSEKAGLNLRNQIAHGLMDIYEYTFPNIVTVLCIILKLSKYNFVKR
ncbi:DUF4209 domain-containing protein [uncultured Christiangramia sp.]|uniref:DUF4209 domain-containing protein n=1 Tax=uncultured Christiangramia sp. TaxID=503836 RepID=UPI0026147D5A|nr:DUF4209 domain-containing protein [uncultured Christiangramia sp.]